MYKIAIYYRYLRRYLSRKFKKNKKHMYTEEELISYKQNFTGVEFQWIKTSVPGLLGKVVKCRDVQPKGNSVFAYFDDGSNIPISRITNDLLMIHGDMKPLSKNEVESIYTPLPPPNVPDPNKSRAQVEAERIKPNSKAAPVKSAVNPFEMFNSDETDLNIKIKIKLPDKKLLKMMYNNAEDKDVFINQLSDYVTSSINNKVISESLLKTLSTKPSTKKAGTVKITKVE